ncbi:hypothetical protein [Kitasatospora sp. GP82]|uniref:hypothetical protein n=1 Tax=Kitasatospora sp. GP82 TaxID=3035089 RepID=UPI0024757D11|nr:hypothetical protein [Kitasatospora sp. GP82]MDH6123451.1 hypothetical protein [Kitasatospora sp. GP82]
MPEPTILDPGPPACGHCGAPALVQWQRRPTDTELADVVAAEQELRTRAAQLADPERPVTFGPIPTAADTTLAVQACADHAINLDTAAKIHAADCPAPHPDHLPACGCQPEPHPEPEPHPGAQVVTLPTGWIVPAQPAH